MMVRKRRGRVLSDDEKSLWQRVAETITPLDANQRAHMIAALEEIAPPPVPESPVVPAVVAKPVVAPALASAEALQALVVGAKGRGEARPESPKPAYLPLQHGTSPGVDRRTADRFRRGRMVIDGRIDLHGMTQEQAHIALHHFIEGQHAHQARCVLVITGKGARGEGVLRRTVPRWLNDPRLRPLILSFSHAQIPDGGDGALYVLLRRHREER